MDRKILITGTGIISAMGRNTKEVAKNLYQGNAVCITMNFVITITPICVVMYQAGKKITTIFSPVHNTSACPFTASTSLKSYLKP